MCEKQRGISFQQSLSIGRSCECGLMFLFFCESPEVPHYERPSFGKALYHLGQHQISGNAEPSNNRIDDFLFFFLISL